MVTAQDVAKLGAGLFAIGVTASILKKTSDTFIKTPKKGKSKKEGKVQDFFKSWRGKMANKSRMLSDKEALAAFLIGRKTGILKFTQDK